MSPVRERGFGFLFFTFDGRLLGCPQKLQRFLQFLLRDVQAHLRHTDIGTTLNEYTQSIPDSVRKLVNAVANDVMSSGAKLEHGLLTARVQ